jgi:hypothetical protein
MTPDVTLFLRTYRGDAQWVVELMRSIDRWVKIGTPDGFRELVVHVDPQDEAMFKPIIGARGRIVSSEPWCKKPYINQQAVKLHCDLWCKSPYVLFIDSDYCFNDTATPDSFFVNGLPDLLITRYAALAGTVPWQQTVERIMGEPAEYETMRGARLCHVTELFPALRNFISEKHGTPDVGHWLCQFPQLSEFNLAGTFAYKVARDRYHWRDTEKMPLPKNPIIQFYSRGGITPEVRMKIEHSLA